jgi:thiamine-monophosphate kinase
MADEEISERTLRDIGEFALIERLVADTPERDSIEVGPGDDAAVVGCSDGRMVVCVDVLVEGRHFRRDWSTAIDIGRRAAAASLSDINAMGAVSTSLLVGLAAPGDLPGAWLMEAAAGLKEEAANAGAVLIGGDTTEGDSIVLSVTALGSLEGRAPVVRGGAQVGDRVVVSGRLGWAAAGLAVLGRGFRSPKVLVDAHRFPVIDYTSGPRAAAAGATAMIDVSDGLLADLGHIAEASGVRIDVRAESLEVPEPLQAAAAAYNVDPRIWMLSGGDDHALVACLPPDVAVPEGFVEIGSVESGSGNVTVDGSEPEGSSGFVHFST